MVMEQLELLLIIASAISGNKKLCPVERNGCGVSKRINQFHKNHHNRDGRSNICGKCTNKRNAAQKQVLSKTADKQSEIKTLFFKVVGINLKAATKAMENERNKK